MKQTYKLIGVMWDGLDILSNLANVDNEIVNDADFILYQLSELLKIECFDFVSDIENKSIVINVDYWPNNQFTYVMDFYVKRLLQILFCIKVRSKKIFVKCKDNTIHTTLINSLEDYYKRKTPQDCWRNQ